MPWKEVSIMSQRREFVTFASSENANIRDLCCKFNISPTTAYKWLARYRAEGESGLADRSRRPHSSPFQTSPKVERRIVALHHKYPAWGGRKLRDRALMLGHTQLPSPSTITEILRRNQLLNPEESAKHQAFRRYEKAAPNELWQMDFKGEFKLPQGRCYPFTVLDDHSRFALALTACARNTHNVTQTALIEVFRRYGGARGSPCHERWVVEMRFAQPKIGHRYARTRVFAGLGPIRSPCLTRSGALWTSVYA